MELLESLLGEGKEEKLEENVLDDIKKTSFNIRALKESLDSAVKSAKWLHASEFANSLSIEYGKLTKYINAAQKALNESNLMESIRIDTERYESAHGRKPRGKGAWAIEIEKETYFSREQLSIPDAVQWALKQHEKKHPNSKIYSAIVMP